jgi:ABC-type sugar transport system permease subunit
MNSQSPMTIKQKTLEAIGDLSDNCSMDELYGCLDFLAATRPEAASSFEKRPLTVGEWWVTLIVLCVPLLNIILCLVWALRSSGNIHRKNFCRATLFLIPVAVVIALVRGFLKGVS